MRVLWAFIWWFLNQAAGFVKIFLCESKAFWKRCFWFLYLQLVGAEKKLRKNKRQFHLTSLPFRGQAASTHRAAFPGWQLLLFCVHHMHLGCKGKGRGPGFQPCCGMLSRPLSAGCGFPLSSCPPGPLLAPQLHLVPGPQSWSPSRAKPTSQQAIGGNGSCIFWFSAIVINGKVVTFLTSQFLCSVPVEAHSGNGTSPPCHLDWSDRTTAGLWRKGRWAPAVSSPQLTQDEATDLDYDKDTNTFPAITKKDTLQTLSLLLFQH